ncbi:MAG TPA: electron transfer flavoprotein subunit alpha/FixB family protein [Candidatus Thermoplasmatota archaeon]|nr:electron transfer flavoprotein subunit alpha/FixB family protein [Candidatus Thermoplasmatota archaeon]
MPDILVTAPDAEHGFELVAQARTLAQASGGKVVYAALGDQAAQAKEFGARGADKVVTCADAKLSPYQTEPYTDAYLQLIEKLKPGIVLIGAGIRSKDAAARVATKLEVGCACEIMNLRLENGRLTGERVYFSGRSLATEQLLKDPQIATVPARLVDAPAADPGRNAPIEPIALTFSDPKAKITKREKKEAGDVHLEDADIVVSAGRGIKKKEDLKLAEDLAAAIGGQVGCTRPIAADLKWLGDAHWIGLSGHEVKPKAYIGLGVSGQIQHVAGMRSSKLIIAINKDEEAPLVKISDYAIVDDLYKVVPALIEAVKKARG